MQKINFFEFDKQADLPELSSWKSKFGKTEVYQNIVQFILKNENATLFKELHFDGALDKSGEQQRKTIVAKNEQNEIVGFITLDEEKSDAVYVKFIVVSPKFAHKYFSRYISAFKKSVAATQRCTSATMRFLFCLLPLYIIKLQKRTNTRYGGTYYDNW